VTELKIHTSPSIAPSPGIITLTVPVATPIAKIPWRAPVCVLERNSEIRGNHSPVCTWGCKLHALLAADMLGKEGVLLLT
jgi:hypothetical protein